MANTTKNDKLSLREAADADYLKNHKGKPTDNGRKVKGESAQ